MYIYLFANPNKMREKASNIIFREFEKEMTTIEEIVGLGSVNRVFDVEVNQEKYIIRINEDTNKLTEYKKEAWCLNEMLKLDIKAPKVLKIGLYDGVCYMIQEKIEGKNGKLCDSKTQLNIWFALGTYVKKYHQIERIKVAAFEENEFHENWKARLIYNLKELNKQDSLLKNSILTAKEQDEIKATLEKLTTKELREGLVHGDLCPRNVIQSNQGIYLLDWGTAEINVVPHNEIGLVLMSKEANNTAFQLFLKGLGISNTEFESMKDEIYLLQLLHQLDKYRWAETYDIENISRYETEIRNAFQNVNQSKRR